MSKAIRAMSGRRGADPRRRGAGHGAFFVLGLMLLVSGCNYTFMAGAGFPPHVRTIAVVPFENRTDRFELTQEVHARMLEDLPRSFRLRTAGEEHADAVVRGTIRSYGVETPSFRPGQAGQRPEVVERQVSLSVSIQIIDLRENVILWDNQSLTVRGEFAELTELEEDGRRVAIEKLVQTVVDGLQSNW